MTLVLEQIRQSPFRGDKFNVAPNDEMCKTCGKCCNEKFNHMEIIPIDFEEDKIEESLRWLMERKLLFIKLYNANFKGGYYEPLMLQIGKCYFLRDDGCILTTDKRPITCTHYGPVRFTKKGTPVKRKIHCDFIWSDWLEQLVIDKTGSKYGLWELRSWKNYREILGKLFEELPPNRKIELSRSSWGIKIVNPYESVDIIYTERKKKE